MRTQQEAPDTGLSAELTARLDLVVGGLDKISAALRDEAEERQRMAQAVRQIPLNFPALNAAGIMDARDSLMAKTGFFWSIRRIVATGFTAGTVTVYRNGYGTGGEVLQVFTATAGAITPNNGTITPGRGEMLLNPGDAIVVGTSGLTGTPVLYGAADCFEQWYLPYYIG